MNARRGCWGFGYRLLCKELQKTSISQRYPKRTKIAQLDATIDVAQAFPPAYNVSRAASNRYWHGLGILRASRGAGV